MARASRRQAIARLERHNAGCCRRGERLPALSATWRASRNPRNPGRSFVATRSPLPRAKRALRSRSSGSPGLSGEGSDARNRDLMAGRRHHLIGGRDERRCRRPPRMLRARRSCTGWGGTAPSHFGTCVFGNVRAFPGSHRRFLPPRAGRFKLCSVFADNVGEGMLSGLPSRAKPSEIPDPWGLAPSKVGGRAGRRRSARR